MRSRPTALSPLTRWFAAVTLVVWIGAQVQCQSYCLTEVCHGESDGADHHASGAAASHHGDEHAPQPNNQKDNTDASCLTLNSALTGSGASTLVTPQFSVLYTLAPAALVLDAADIELAASFSREARLREWVFTPEVSLGPAFRSHAPPSPSLA